MKKCPFKKSLLTALRGIAADISTERNIKIQIAIGILVIIVSLLLKIPRVEFALILIVCFFVISLEMINTSIEKLIDKLSPGQDNDYGRVTDLMAVAVLLAVILSVILGFLILLNPIIDFFKNTF